MQAEKACSATVRAAVFLRAPHAPEQARAHALEQGVGLLLSAVLQFVVAGRDDLALVAYNLYLQRGE